MNRVPRHDGQSHQCSKRKPPAVVGVRKFVLIREILVASE
jgi:hypothetical protein